MNSFDLSILTCLNSFPNLHPRMDVLITYIEEDNLIKVGVLMTVWWYFWFKDSSEKDQNATQAKLLTCLFAMSAGLFLARALTHLLPFRIRPFSNLDLHFVIPNWNGVIPLSENWSAFPSDHAVLWFSIAATFYLINKSIGWIAIAYVSLLSVGRVYVGYHHPTDMLAGAVLGVVLVGICNSNHVRNKIIPPILSWGKAEPGWFYGAAFFCTYEIANMFKEARSIVHLGLRMLL